MNTAILRTVLSYFFGIMLALGALAHVLKPEFYGPMVPAPIPLVLANVVATIVEGLLAVLIFVPSTRRWGLLGFTALMFAFLPIHLWDLVREDHIFGSQQAAWIRLVIQFAFIAVGIWLTRNEPARRPLARDVVEYGAAITERLEAIHERRLVHGD